MRTAVPIEARGTPSPPPGGIGNGGSGRGPTAGPTGPSSPEGGGPNRRGPRVPGNNGPGGSHPVTGSTPFSADLTQWSFWWEFNKEPYLNLKSHVYANAAATGSDGFFLGRGHKGLAQESLRPSETQIRESVVPALLAALESESNNDIITGCLIALAKIGDLESETGESVFEGVIAAWLADNNQEISETAAIALGILSNPASIGTLTELLFDTEAGRRLVGDKDVSYRTRAFAAYGLGLIGGRTGSENDRQRIVQALARVIEDDTTRTRDLKVSCIIAMGLVPLATIDGTADDGALLPTSRLAEIAYLLEFFEDDRQNFLVRAHCPAAMARLLDGMPAGAREEARATIAESLLVRVTKAAKEPLPVVQSSVQALGLLGTNDGRSALDKRIRKALALVPKQVKDHQARYFSMIAMAQVGARPGEDVDCEGALDASSYLLSQLARGKNQAQPWAGLACGVMGSALATDGDDHPLLSTLRISVRYALQNEKDQVKIAAYSIANGMLRDEESSATMMKLLGRVRDDETRGYIAIGLGLMNAREAIGDIDRIIATSKYRPELLRQAAVALGLLGDKNVVDRLVAMLKEAKYLATQAAISSALGFIGDRDSIAPLIEMLRDEDLSHSARGFAAAALGIVADKEPLPWNSRVSVNLNYRAATATLTNRSSGILDIL